MRRLCAGALLNAVESVVPLTTRRREIKRATGGWSCSTLAGYLYDGDEITFYSNFRKQREAFDHMVELVRPS